MSSAQAGLVALRSFSTPTEASMAKARLEQAGIAAYLDNENLVAANWLLSNATGGVKVLVSEIDAARANDILDTRFELDEEDRDEDDGYAEEAYRCPKCHRKQISFVGLHIVVLTLSLLLLGIPLMFIPRKKHCRDCDHIW